MKRSIFIVVSVLLAFALQSRAQLPPLIDRELFFDDPEISIANISPDGRFISFVKPFKGVRNIWVKERTEPFEKARPITADTARPVVAYFWSQDSRRILYAQDKGGDENYRIYAVDPTAAGEPVPPAKDLTPIEKVRAVIYDVPKKRPHEILIGLNDRRADLHDVYRLNINTGERTLIRRNDQNVVGWMTDLDGNLRLGLRITAAGGSEILRVEKDTLVSIYSVTAEESCSPIRFSPDGGKFYLITNKGEQIDKLQLELYDLATGKTTLVDKDPKGEVDFSSALFSDLTNELLATFYLGDRVRIYLKQKKFRQDFARLRKALPDGEISIAGMTADENLWMVSVSRDVDPGARYLFDRTTGKMELLYRVRPNLPTEHLAPMKAVRYKARDGLMIPAYLTLPKGVPPKNLPVVMFIHGGPWARDVWGYNPTAQFFANRGYAVFQPNFRGSSGYGKKFLNAGNKQWGTGFMQHDITDGVKYLIKEGIADPKRIAIYGGSYGGYATLAGLAFTPELYSAGVSFVGPSNIVTLLKTIPPYWAPLKKIFDVRVGSIDNPDDVKRLEEQSPLNAAKNIKAPLLVVQGANDPRVKKSESDQIVVAVRDRGLPVEYLVAPDEGHGFLGRENRLAFYTVQEKFLAKHLGGRVQKSVSPEVQRRIEALTVDVTTVTMPAKPSGEAVAPIAVFEGSRIRPHSSTYTTRMSVMGRDFTIPSTRTISAGVWEGRKVWRVIEEVSGAMGGGSDTLDLDAETMLPIRRSAVQGTTSVRLQFKPDGVAGKIVAGSQEVPVNVKTNEPVLADGAGTELAVSTLPLAEGFKASFSVLDLTSLSVKRLSLRVVGVEKVSSALGTLDAYKIELNPVEGNGGESIIWISRADGRKVKSESKLPPQMGGGTAVSELSK